jgi:hypothetical protein
MSTCINSG